MRAVELDLELMEEVVLSERNATEGGHRTLRYIPGATLLGAAAAKLYRGMRPDDAFTMFHSGKVRFGNGLPTIADGSTGWPVPICWHHAKRENVVVKRHGKGYFDGEKLFHLGVCDIPDNQQPVQLRDSFVEAVSGEKIDPATRFRMKTAIEPDTARAAQGQLFGYESLVAGQTFRACLKADDDVEQALWQQVVGALEGEIRLGRSRSAQYGVVRVTAHNKKRTSEVPDDLVGTKNLELWLLSDLSVRDDHGTPSLTPQPQWLGLPKGELILRKSFLRTRRYSPYNAARRCYDVERQVIEQGSVLYFELQMPLTEDHIGRLQSGVGEWRETGLGCIAANAPILAHGSPRFESQEGSAEEIDTHSAMPPLPLARWLTARAALSGREDSARIWAEAQAVGLEQLYESAYRLAGLARGVPCGPGRAQWGQVLDAAKSQTEAEALRITLFEGQAPICAGKANEDWRQEGMAEDGAYITFTDWLGKRFTQAPDPKPRALAHFSRLALDIVRKFVEPESRL